MLKHGEPNPLAVFGLRRLDHCPLHFTKLYYDLYVNEKKIIDWVYENLEGRFWAGEEFILEKLDHNDRFIIKKCIAFEIPSESTLFALIIDQLNHRDFEF